MRQTPTIAKNYPYGMSNSEIEKDIQDFFREINVNAGRPTVSACYAPLIQLGQSELQFRLAKKTFWISLLIGLLSLTISCVALGLAYNANHSSDEWEKNQIALLKTISEQLKKSVNGGKEDSQVEKPANKPL
ncbi:hypothetical protein [Kushneria phyllosphaerae]|uniref:Uncharacterized protein n=1 Tax=Kushneria phyllosphaerae TaxID=2100822 RepID=A0A2R8CPY7_9GAMM|nr:hypothetical protein [Kushneria phyllosphaerae]SPJ34971.1 hypothetical protein KSP9073_03020 [Kushneria phyllosphaerae]